MKEYNRQSKIWQEIDPNNKKESLKQRELCVGQKPHQYELVMPDYITRTNQGTFSQETIIKFYSLEDQLDECNKAHKESLLELGIDNGYSGTMRNVRYFACAVCGRKIFNRD